VHLGRLPRNDTVASVLSPEGVVMKKYLACGVLLGLSACGGSSSSRPASQLESAPAPAQPFNIPMSHLIGLYSYYMTYSEAANTGTTSFRGQVAHSATSSLAVFNGNETVLAQMKTEYFLANPYAPLGLAGLSSAVSYVLVYNSVTPLPAVLQVNDSGPLVSGTYYQPGTNTSIGSLTETYSVTGYNSTPLELSISATGILNGAPISQTVSYTVDATGNVNLSSFQFTPAGGTTLYFYPPEP
jgi:hypothetical protein